MAILRAQELRGMNDEELDKHLSELRLEYMKIKGVLSSGGIPEDIGKAREIKRTMARILTIKNEDSKEKRNELS
ncbi:MAG: 50S ribosomal protein L29 [Candidatus Altiarchaeales archaeon]|nr:50S ribosomal protein L29 [Candidatus Altiarchaeota archaeon]MBU4265675.1 50S ribosomal protein L29 [Candidatus Altiarchaeota archaeon]MBU4341410.1 50S ribosomal protein L29 [Candidatus Altiarchaeota archaeon]MBU4436857.1 50S ribosomal protein L29 [Candidatus Altiarchaeota archaeon]MCG2782608.1 50S ribosomal protein L29 [Candidatus Altiarchaeales archaeon]